ESQPTSIVITSVVGLPKRQLQLIAVRAARSYPRSRIIVLNASAMAEPDAAPGRVAEKDLQLDVKHTATVVELIGNLKVSRVDPTITTVDPRPSAADAG